MNYNLVTMRTPKQLKKYIIAKIKNHDMSEPPSLDAYVAMNIVNEARKVNESRLNSIKTTLDDHKRGIDLLEERIINASEDQIDLMKEWAREIKEHSEPADRWNVEYGKKGNLNLLLIVFFTNLNIDYINNDFKRIIRLVKRMNFYKRINKEFVDRLVKILKEAIEKHYEDAASAAFGNAEYVEFAKKQKEVNEITTSLAENKNSTEQEIIRKLRQRRPPTTPKLVNTTVNVEENPVENLNVM